MRSEGCFSIGLSIFFDLIKTYSKRDLSFYSNEQAIWLESSGAKIQLPHAFPINDPMQLEKMRIERNSVLVLKKKRKETDALETGQKVFYVNDENVICEGVYIQSYGKEVVGYKSRQVFVKKHNGEAIVIDREKILEGGPTHLRTP